VLLLVLALLMVVVVTVAKMPAKMPPKIRRSQCTPHVLRAMNAGEMHVRTYSRLPSLTAYTRCFDGGAGEARVRARAEQRNE
jgi:hypothetical protein